MVRMPAKRLTAERHRAKFSETAFLEFYLKFSEAPDPSPVLQWALVGLATTYHVLSLAMVTPWCRLCAVQACVHGFSTP